NPVLLYRDVDDLVNKLSLLIEDKNTREKLRENARKYVEENRMDVITDKFLKLFETVKEKVVA
ncbi:MAG: glycosyltransferase family 1 protein, partial [Thermoplasmata archaeon]